MYEIEYTIEAIEDLKLYRKHEWQLIVDQIDEQLSHCLFIRGKEYQL